MAWWGTDVPAERAALAVNDLVEACDGVERLKSFLMQLGGHGAPWAEGVADGVYVGQAIERDDGAGVAAGEQSLAVPTDGARPQPSASSSSSGNVG
jgi:hypothetical protein